MKKAFVGQQVIRLSEVGSTNRFMQDFLKENALPEGSVIWTSNQTNGRGQQGKTWLSEQDANLACSMILYPDFLPPDQQFYLSKCIALAVRDFIQGLTKDPVLVKWPNDIYVSERKVAGILIENSIRGFHLQQSIVGIGINVNQAEFPLDLPHAGSLYQLTGKEFDLEKCLRQLSSAIEKRYFIWNEEPECYDEEYLTHQFKGTEWTQFGHQGKMLDARIKEITVEGYLLLEMRNGKERAFAHHEIDYTIP